jgi:hypothetical protein
MARHPQTEIHAEITLTIPPGIIKNLILNYCKEAFPSIPGYEPQSVSIEVKEQIVYIEGLVLKVSYGREIQQPHQ